MRIGAVDHLAPGEDIRAVRFDGDRGYVVTFKKTDPLFVLDLRDPVTPAVLGELKIPGFSTYLHRIDPTHLLSIGFDASDHGDFAFFDGVILQIFDVTRPTEPVLLHRRRSAPRGSSSEAATDHLAFNYFAERNLLAIPMTVCEGGGDGTYGDRLAFSGLLVYDVTVDHGFRRLGGVDHGASGASGAKGASCNTWWANATSHVKRSIFMDDRCSHRHRPHEGAAAGPAGAGRGGRTARTVGGERGYVGASGPPRHHVPLPRRRDHRGAD